MNTFETDQSSVFLIVKSEVLGMSQFLRLTSHLFLGKHTAAAPLTSEYLNSELSFLRCQMTTLFKV